MIMSDFSRCDGKEYYYFLHSIPERIGKVLTQGIMKTQSVETLESLKTGKITILSGSVGIGKTIAMYNYMNHNTKGKGYTTASKLYRMLKRDTDKIIELVTDVDILLIDGLGEEYEAGSGFFVSLLDEIINIRYENLKTTIIATNLNAEKFRTRYGDRIADRINEDDGFIGSTEKSLRKKKL